VRDFLLSETLKRLSAEAATRFSAMVASGDQIPFDVAESAGSESAFHSYRPLTERFVRERAAELRSLPAFEPAREAVEAAGVAAPYLEQHGEVVPADPAERADLMLIAFFAALWDGCGEFSLDLARLDGALAVLEAEAGDAHDADVLIAPLVGLRMSQARLRVTEQMELVRADMIEAPLEAMRSEGMGRAAWEPQFLAVAEQGEEADSAAAALRRLHHLISAMRIFKEGGVGLGPFAFAPTGEGCWRRLATGVAPPRAGGYRVSKQDAAELVGLVAALEARPEPGPVLAWALRRFEMGCERQSALEGLSDHLLALRAALDGQGPVGATLPMRAAALIAAESDDRGPAHDRFERAIELESSLMRGGRPEAAGELAGWLEGCVREILRNAALGELGTDLGTAADETLIATGLAAGDAQISVSVEAEADRLVLEEAAAAHVPASEPEPSEEDHMDEHDTRILEPIPGDEEIKITASNWLDEVSTSGQTLEWPVGSEEIGRRERIDPTRVRHLFPVPEDADWEIRELDYDHYSRRAG
jgi:hypothetical protein